MDIRIPVIAAVTLLISLSEGSSRSVSILAIYNPCLIFLHSLNFFSYQAASLVPTKTGYECDDTSVYGTCAEIVAKHSLQDILTNMCRWDYCFWYTKCVSSVFYFKFNAFNANFVINWLILTDCKIKYCVDGAWSEIAAWLKNNIF